MEHKMRLKPEPFEQIRSKRKTIELRLYDDKRRAISIGDTVEFTSTLTGDSLRARVIALHLFDSFADLYGTLPLIKCGYTEETVLTADASDMDAYYSREEQSNFGVVGIEIELL